jgi:hypothetical protein
MSPPLFIMLILSVSEVSKMKVLGVGRGSATMFEAGFDSVGLTFYDVDGWAYAWALLQSEQASRVRTSPIIVENTLIPNTLNFEREIASFEGLIADLEGVPKARAYLEAMLGQVKAFAEGEDVIVLLVSLDCSLAFATCDLLAATLKETGATVLALVGAPNADLPAGNQTCIRRLAACADFVFHLGGYWRAKYVDFESKQWVWNRADEIKKLALCLYADIQFRKALIPTPAQTSAQENYGLVARFDASWFQPYESELKAVIELGRLTVSESIKRIELSAVIVLVSAAPFLADIHLNKVCQIISQSLSRQRKVGFVWQSQAKLIGRVLPQDVDAQSVSSCFIDVFFITADMPYKKTLKEVTCY